MATYIYFKSFMTVIEEVDNTGYGFRLAFMGIVGHFRGPYIITAAGHQPHGHGVLQL